MLNFDRSAVKRGTQNIQNDCHQWLYGSFTVHRIRFRPGTPQGELTALTQTADWFKGALRLRAMRRGIGERESKRGEEGNWRDPPPFRKFLDPPLG